MRVSPARSASNNYWQVSNPAIVPGKQAAAEGLGGGLLLVDKPPGISSHDVVARARRLLGQRRVGHLGTLDPFATGLLVLVAGRATRLARFMDGEPKVYSAQITFGTATDSDDSTGTVVSRAPLPDPAELSRAIAGLTGNLQQLPPVYSAKQVGGERSYLAARAGRTLPLTPVTVRVHEWVVHRLTAEAAEVTITCGGGTYIRSLARDLGRMTGSAAHLSALRRVGSGPFNVKSAVPLAELERGGAPVLLSALEALGSLERVTIDTGERAMIVRGVPVSAASNGSGLGALIDASGELVAVAERDGERWLPRVVLRDV